MSATADTIWQVPAYLPYLQPALTDGAVAAAEKKIGYKLPSEYLQLLTKQNGGYIRYTLPETPHTMIAGIGPHFPNVESYLALKKYQKRVSFPLKGLVPFDGDGHWHICLDYRKNSAAPSITYVDIETDHERSLAGTFVDYLSRLKVSLAPAEFWEEYVLDGVSIEAVVSALSVALGVEFFPPDSDLYGYPLHRCRLGAEDQPEWVSVGPNLVLRGFVRASDPRYSEVHDLMPGEAPRFLDVPHDACILNVSKSAGKKLIEACARSNFSVRPLRDYVKDI
jgi:SMI1-KNR4 cell-wall